MKKEFNVDIWKLIDLNEVNLILDELFIDKGINPVEIKYKCKSIDENGRLLLEAEFNAIDDDDLPVEE